MNELDPLTFKVKWGPALLHTAKTLFKSWHNPHNWNQSLKEELPFSTSSVIKCFVLFIWLIVWGRKLNYMVIWHKVFITDWLSPQIVKLISWKCIEGVCYKKKIIICVGAARRLIKSHSAQLICTRSWKGNIQSNCSLCVRRTHMYSFVRLQHYGTPAAMGISLKQGGGQLRHFAERGMTWINERRVRSGLELNVLLSGRKNGGTRGRRGSTRSVTQLSAGVVFNWINLLWNVHVLPGPMPCVHRRLGRRVGGGEGLGVWGTMGRLCHETGSEKANSPTGFESFIPSHPVTPVLLCLNLFLHPRIQHQNKTR